MQKQQFYDTVDALQQLKVEGFQTANTSATWRTTAVDVTKELVLKSDHATKQYSTGDFWDKVADKMVEYGLDPDVDSDEAALQDLLADLEYPAAHNTQSTFVAYLRDLLGIPNIIVFTLVNGEYAPLDIIAAVAKTNGTTVESAVVKLPANYKLLILSMMLAASTEASVLLEYAVSVDAIHFSDYTKIDTATADGVKISHFDIENRAKYVKFKMSVTGASTVSLKGALR